MTKLTTQINLRVLKAVALAASTEKTRPYLNGVLIECREDSVTYVATNGHLLLAYRDELENTPESVNNILTGDFIIPLEVIKGLKPQKYTDSDVLSKEPESLKLLFELAGTLVTPIDGFFPDWRRIVPPNYEGAPEGVPFFNPDYVALMARFYEILGNLKKGKGAKNFSLVASDEGSPAAVVFSATPQAFGVLMPLRNSPPLWEKPSWACFEEPASLETSNLEAAATES